MSGLTPFDRTAEAESRHALLFTRILDQVAHVAPGLPGYYTATEIVDASEIKIRSQFRDGEGTHEIVQKIAVEYRIYKISDA